RGLRLRVPEGARRRVEMHRTPNGTATEARSRIGITFAKKPPKYEMFMSEFANLGISVPAFDPHHRAEASMRLPADARILSFTPHMHWRGKDYFYEAIYPDGRRETLLTVPRWDFNWQSVYQFKEAVRAPKGTRIHAVAHWDNSRNNPLNPDPDKEVRFGLRTWDETRVGWVAYVWERPGTAEEWARRPAAEVEADVWFDRLDRNGDDVVTADEIPDQLKLFLRASNVKVPERMTRAEF